MSLSDLSAASFVSLSALLSVTLSVADSSFPFPLVFVSFDVSFVVSVVAFLSFFVFSDEFPSDFLLSDESSVSLLSFFSGGVLRLSCVLLSLESSLSESDEFSLL